MEREKLPAVMFGSGLMIIRSNDMTEIIVALITGVLAFLGVVVTNVKASKVTDYKIEELTREVREHNNFAKRMPVVEEQIRVINHRIDDLEHKVG